MRDYKVPGGPTRKGWSRVAQVTEIGPRIRALREGRGLRRENLAVAAERSTATIELYENGRVCPPVAVLERLAAVLGVTLADLFAPTGTDA